MFRRCSAASLARFVKSHSEKDFGCRLRLMSSAGYRPNHYETLGVDKKSTQKEIRDAYVKLSKEHHPDLGGSAAKFDALTQAYKVLTNKGLKKIYDDAQETMSRRRRPGAPGVDDLGNYGASEAPPSHGSPESDGYYGIQGVRRVSNGMIALICMAFIVVTGFSQVVGLKAVSKMRDERFKEQTALYLRQEAESKIPYQNLTQQERIQLFKERAEARPMEGYWKT